MSDIILCLNIALGIMSTIMYDTSTSVYTVGVSFLLRRRIHEPLSVDLLLLSAEFTVATNLLNRSLSLKKESI